MANLYEALGVAPDATQDEIKAAYRAKAQTTHPDRGGDTEEFKALATAYDVLSDAARRAKYDTTGDTKVRDLPAEAEQAAATMFSNSIEQSENPEFLDMLDHLTRHVEGQQMQIMTNRGKAAKGVVKLNKAIKKTTRKAGVNLAVRVMANRVADLQKQISKMDEEIELAKLIKAVLSDYSYAFEQGVTVSVTGNTYTTFYDTTGA